MEIDCIGGNVKRSRVFSPDRYRRQTQSRLVIVGFLILIGVGGGLVGFFYGQTAALTAVACIAGGTGVFGLLWLILTLIELWVRDDES